MSKIIEDNNFVKMPFGGLLGNSVIVRVLQELVADPISTYSQSDLSNLTGSSMPSVKDAIVRLEKLGFVFKTNKNEHRPTYNVATRNKRFVALTLLAYATLDDRNGSSIMDVAMAEYIGEQGVRYFQKPQGEANRNYWNCPGNGSSLVGIEPTTQYIEDQYDRVDQEEMLPI
ncbi:MAG: hypothetical protein ACYCPR_04490 [Thermoplasmataceae archaeon]|jgi:hypothetical protein